MDNDDTQERPDRQAVARRHGSGQGTEQNLTPGLMRILTRVMDTIPTQINVKDSQRRYIFVNRGLFEYYGDEPDYTLGKTAEDFMAPEQAAEVTAGDRAVLESGRPTGMKEHTDVDLQGRTRHWLVGKWPLTDAAGSVANIITVAFDITELHQARKAGAEHERMLGTVTSQAPLILLKTILWPDGTATIPFIAGRLVDAFRIDREAISTDARFMAELIHPDDRADVIDRWRRAIRAGENYACEFRAVAATGEIRWLSDNASQRFEDDGRIVVDEVIVDVTELHRARQLARQSEDQLISLARNVPGLISRHVTTSDSASIPFLSADFAQRMAIDPEAARTDAAELWRHIHPDDRPVFTKAWRDSQETLSPFDHTCRFVGPLGEVSWYRSRCLHRRMDNGDIVSDMLAIDVTEEKRAELELQRERELFQSVASHLPGLIFRRITLDDGTMRYDYIEGALLDRLGLDRVLVRRDPEVLWQHFTSVSAASARAVLLESQATLKPYTLLLRCRPPGAGEDLYIEVTGTPRTSAAGIVVDGIAVDVTARTRAETDARDQRLLLQQVIDAVPAAINVKNRLGQIELANQTLADCYGVSPAELLWDAARQIEDPPQDEATTREWDEAVMRTGVVSDAREHAYVDQEGRTRHWLGKKSPLRNPETGIVERVVTVSLDVTDRVVAEERARHNVELLRSVAANIPGAVLRWHLDGDHRITQEFAAGRMVQGGHIDGARTSGRLAEIWPRLLAEDAARLGSALEGTAGERATIELDLRMRAGEETRWTKLYGSRRADREDSTPAWDIIVLDATESKRYEEQLRIAQKMDAIGNLTGGIAHDFNNILAVIVANLDLLLDLGPHEEEGREVAQAALRAAERGAELTGRLLTFARNQPAEPRTFDCAGHIDGFLSFMHRSLGPEIELDLRRGSQVPFVNVDPGQFENALMNLVVNARDAMDGRGRIVIASEVVTLGPEDQLPALLEPGRYAVVSVTDSGAGMAPEVQRRAFEPLFTTKSQGRGTGYGLPMVYNFAKQAGGLVTLYSEPGLGTTVRIYLPSPLASEEATAPQPAPCSPATQGLAAARVLLVDDNVEARTALARQLARQGIEVLQAGDAAEALALARRDTGIDLLITDIIMPGDMNGAELADLLREQRPELPILLTSGYSSDALAERRLTRGHYELLNKPFRERELLAAVGRLLGIAPG
ncbi:MAG: PAS domain-containing protein [Proteobacteria bacterium]|nr:PAS domain-containing protein [Pseudomonadota bacterium]